MFRQQIRLSLFAVLAAFTLALTGCGGGGGGGNGDGGMMPEEPDPQMVCEDAGGRYNADGSCTSADQLAEEKALSDAQGAAMAAANAAKTASDNAAGAVAGIEAIKEYDETSYGVAKAQAAAAMTAYMQAKAASDMAQSATTSADAEKYRDLAMLRQGDAEAAETAAMTAAGMVTAAKKDADDTAAENAARAAVTKAAGTKLTAMNAEAGQGPGQTPANPDAGLGGSARTDTTRTDGDTSNDVYMLAISRDRAGTTVKVTDPDQNNRADPKFVDQMAGLDSGRSMFVRTQDADADGNVEEEVVVVGTDIRAPRVRPFGRVHSLNARDLDPNTDADGDGVNNDDYTAIFIGTTDTPGTAPADAPSAAILMLVKSAAFPLTGDAVLSFDSNTDGTVVDEADEVGGYYNGALGTYRCNAASGTDCTVTVGPSTADPTKRAITAMSTGWIFTPNAGVTVDVPDTSYLHYGFWLKKTTDEDGAVTYNEVETFAGASIDASGDVSAVQGTAVLRGRSGRRLRPPRPERGRWQCRVVHLRPLQGGRKPDGYLRADSIRSERQFHPAEHAQLYLRHHQQLRPVRWRDAGLVRNLGQGGGQH